jgi:hypothetical protein
MARLYLVHPDQPVAKAAIFFEGTVAGDDLALTGLYFKEVNDLLGTEQSLDIPSLSVPTALLAGGPDAFTPSSDKTVFEMPGAEASTAGGAFSISWSKVRLTLAGPTLPVDPTAISFTIEVFDIEVGSDNVDFMTLSGDLKLPFDGSGKLISTDFSFTRKGDVLTELPLNPDNVKLLEGTAGEPHQFAVRWTEPYTNYWLGRIMPDFLDSGAPVSSGMTLSFLFKFEEGLQEIRLDWELSTDRVYSVLGVDLTLKPEVVISIVLYSDGDKFSDLFLVATVPGGKELGTVSSDFAWLRDLAGEALRELQPNSATPALPKPRPLSMSIGPLPHGGTGVQQGKARRGHGIWRPERERLDKQFLPGPGLPISLSLQ